ncbi:MAG: hypothetical protein EOP48_03985 [Sphingobacteriales bacterium]|nr:MAG: hypothetical protein EOP48_03985 [Sphingobacteriales bacterium]
MTYIDKKEFLRSFAIRPDGAFNIFLGAGASVQANIPAAGTLIWQFKRKLYCDALNYKEEKFKDLESERNRSVIQSYFDLTNGNPPLWHGSEYSVYFEKCYPKSIDRKAFIQKIIHGKNPSIGHRCLGVLFDQKKIGNVWTTNFDELVENGIRMVNNSAQFELISPDNQHQISNLNTYQRVIKLHGDYRYDKLQNTLPELQSLETELHHFFAQQNANAGIIVVGYGGNDQSVIEAFQEALKARNPFPYGLYWCVRKGQVPNPVVQEIIDKVNSLQPEKISGFIEIDGFDEFLYDLYNATGKHDDRIEDLAKIRFENRRPFTSPQISGNFTPIKLNGLKAKVYPKTVLSYKTDLAGWKELREILEGKPIVGALSNGNTLLFGDPREIKNAFEGRNIDELKTLDIDDHVTYHQNSFFIGMLYDLIGYNLRTSFNLQEDPRRKHKYYTTNHRISDEELKKYKVFSTVPIYEAMEIQLEFHNTELFLTILPSVFVDDKQTLDKTRKQSIVNAIFSNRRNDAVNEKERLWIELLKNGKENACFELEDFKIEFETNYASAGFPVSKGFKFQGAFQMPEPFINFHISDTSQRMTHPLKGLKQFGPLDHSYENGQVNPQAIKLAILSPATGLVHLMGHLNGLNQEIQVQSEKDYLIDYLPFSTIYRRYLELPSGSENKLLELINEEDVQDLKLNQFYDFLKRKVDYFYTIRGEFDVLVIYIPTTWAKFRELKNDHIYFDLHDSMKLYCAKKNIKVQFVEDKSLTYFDQAKVHWWLSLGIYAKANGTPWRNETVNDSTAFIGLDFAINRVNSTAKFVLGSSHIFDSSGQGMRFLLQPIENPVFRGKNPFMSKDDARKLILKLKEAYFRMDGNSKLEKLVIHKVLHYTNDEMQGISEALDGIENVELLQIQKYSNWRAIRGLKDSRTNKITIHGYPVQRGTVVQLDDYSFLLWTHGSVSDQDVAGVSRSYYQSSRGIPAPLLVRRFRGTDPIETTVKEILALTKMNWNNTQFDRKLPITVECSKKVGEILKYLDQDQVPQIKYSFYM